MVAAPWRVLQAMQLCDRALSVEAGAVVVRARRDGVRGILILPGNSIVFLRDRGTSGRSLSRKNEL